MLPFQPQDRPSYFTDRFFRVSSAPAAISSLAAMQACWGGPPNDPPTRCWDSERGKVVWDRPTTWNYADLWAVPKSWGDPDTSKPCWKSIGDHKQVVGSVDVQVGNPRYASKPIFLYTAPPLQRVDPRDRQGATTTGNPALDAALTAYANAVKDDAMLIIGAFNCGDTDKACLDLLIAGGQCPTVVNDARKAGKLAAVIASSTPATFCDNVRAAMAGTTDTGDGTSTWLKVAVVAGVVSATIGVIAFLERVKKNPTRSGHMTKAEAVRDFRDEVLPGVSARYGYDKVAMREAWNNYTDALQRSGQITPEQYDTWGYPSGM